MASSATRTWSLSQAWGIAVVAMVPAEDYRHRRDAERQRAREQLQPGPGLLLVTEAGGTASRIDGSPWEPGSPDILISAPGVHQAAVDVLATVH